MNKIWYVYIMSSYNKTLYIWVTNDLIRRVYEHREWLIEWFTKTYNIKDLVYYEECSDIENAILREKQLKKWNRKWKINLIESINKDWNDLYELLV